MCGWALRRCRMAAAERPNTTRPTPVTRAELAREGLGPAFQDYMNGWAGFVAQEPEPA